MGHCDRYDSLIFGLRRQSECAPEYSTGVFDLDRRDEHDDHSRLKTDGMGHCDRYDSLIFGLRRQSECAPEYSTGVFDLDRRDEHDDHSRLKSEPIF